VGGGTVGRDQDSGKARAIRQFPITVGARRTGTRREGELLSAVLDACLQMPPCGEISVVPAPPQARNARLVADARWIPQNSQEAGAMRRLCPMFCLANEIHGVNAFTCGHGLFPFLPPHTGSQNAGGSQVREWRATAPIHEGTPLTG